jgi:hypothetical protein
MIICVADGYQLHFCYIAIAAMAKSLYLLSKHSCLVGDLTSINATISEATDCQF